MIISFAGTRLRRGEVADPEQSAYISECLRRQDYCYITEKTAPKIIKNYPRPHKTLYLFAVRTEGVLRGHIALVNPDKSLKLETEELGELTVSVNIIINYYLEAKENDLTIVKDYV